MKIFSINDQPTKLKLISNKIIFNLLFCFFVNHSSFLKFVQNKKKCFSPNKQSIQNTVLLSEMLNILMVNIYICFIGCVWLFI